MSERIIQHDDFVWRIVSTGAERDGKTWCHLAAVNQKQKDGKTPIQINDWVPNRVIQQARNA